MKEKFYSSVNSFTTILLFVCTSTLYAQVDQDSETVSIDMVPFYSSTHHWYDFFTDSYVISPLPERPQYKETEIANIADNILLFQHDNGGWPKNYDMQAILTNEQKEKLRAVKSTPSATFDNNTTYTQINYLAKAYTFTKISKYKESCLKGLDFILAAQYDNGGWPQYYPPHPDNNEYSTHITYNDKAYIGIMETLKLIVENDPSFSFINNAFRKKLEDAYHKGIDCILKSQIIEDDRLKIWGQQHDKETLEPTWARSFEPPSIANDDSAPIVVFLMSIENPNDEIIESVQAAINWFNESKILNTRCIEDSTASKYTSKYKVHHYDRRIVYDVSAPPVWTRYNELKTGKSLFCDRSGEIVYNMGDLSRERRSGYRWYSYAPQEALDKYPEWQKKWAKGYNVLEKTN